MADELIAVSHPTWVRGLKFTGVPGGDLAALSHPTWVRGLKYQVIRHLLHSRRVAPHVGAWIEISAAARLRRQMPVAPHVGAWIEILVPVR